MKKGGLYPAVANGANEVANRLFRDRKISFLDIGELVTSAVDNIDVTSAARLDDVLRADKAAREYVYSQI
jgi:1-deoxy-D-xylulose-5-phosphate reductoisomerase